MPSIVCRKNRVVVICSLNLHLLFHNVLYSDCVGVIYIYSCIDIFHKKFNKNAKQALANCHRWDKFTRNICIACTLSRISMYTHTHTHQKCNAHSSNWKWVFHSCTLATEMVYTLALHPKIPIKRLESYLRLNIFTFFYLIIELQICIITGKMCKKRKDTKNATAKMCISFMCVCVFLFGFSLWLLSYSLPLCMENCIEFCEQCTWKTTKHESH